MYLIAGAISDEITTRFWSLGPTMRNSFSEALRFGVFPDIFVLKEPIVWITNPPHSGLLQRLLPSVLDDSIGTTCGGIRFLINIFACVASETST